MDGSRMSRETGGEGVQNKGGSLPLYVVQARPWVWAAFVFLFSSG